MQCIVRSMISTRPGDLWKVHQQKQVNEVLHSWFSFSLVWLQREKNGRLSKFAGYVQTFGAGLKGVISQVESGTIFAPNNDAFDRLSQSQLEALLGSEVGPRILGLHFIDQRIPAEDVRILQPQNPIKVRWTLSFLFFHLGLLSFFFMENLCVKCYVWFRAICTIQTIR